VHGLDGGIQPGELSAGHERERGLDRDALPVDAHKTEPF
jgi:hypothetical protein